MTFVKMNAIYRLIGAQAKWLIGRPQEALLCAKEKRQQQMFSVRKRSDSNKCFLCESEATATMFYLCESEATATKRLHVMVMSGKIDNSLEHKKE
ncbi:hypothetical protein [Lysinibacillus sp. RS5]|uniref:hypothetical protein n=1 Tax=unclassified Lysinibacillus TaxID=2636778 RepID=UPI0035BE1853